MNTCLKNGIEFVSTHIRPKKIYEACSDIIFFCHDQILQQMRSDIALLTVEDGGSPIRNPSTAAEDARLASLISLDGILKGVKVFTFLLTHHIVLPFVMLCIKK